MNTFNFRIVSFSLVLAAVLGLCGLAVAAESCCGPGATNLSPEKREIAQRLYEDFYQGTEKTRQELISKRHELGAQMYSANPDESKIQALAKEISELRAKLYNARISLKGTLLKEGITLGYGGGYGAGMRGGCGAGFAMRGGPGAGGGASCCDDAGGGARGGR
jgi:zinc resistance-associated protein